MIEKEKLKEIIEDLKLIKEEKLDFNILLHKLTKLFSDSNYLNYLKNKETDFYLLRIIKLESGDFGEEKEEFDKYYSNQLKKIINVDNINQKTIKELLKKSFNFERKEVREYKLEEINDFLDFIISLEYDLIFKKIDIIKLKFELFRFLPNTYILNYGIFDRYIIFDGSEFSETLSKEELSYITKRIKEICLENNFYSKILINQLNSIIYDSGHLELIDKNKKPNIYLKEFLSWFTSKEEFIDFSEKTNIFVSEEMEKILLFFQKN